MKKFIAALAFVGILLFGAGVAYADSSTSQGSTGGEVVVPGANFSVVEHDNSYVTNGSTDPSYFEFTATCPEGTKVLALAGESDATVSWTDGGGLHVFGLAWRSDSYVDVANNQVHAYVVNGGLDASRTVSGKVYALCAEFTP